MGAIIAAIAIWAVGGAYFYLTGRADAEDERHDRMSRYEAIGFAVTWPLVLLVMVLYRAGEWLLRRCSKGSF